MNFLQEKKTRNFYLFLLVISGVFFSFLLFLGIFSVYSFRMTLAGREMAASSYLLEQGVSPEVIARTWNHLEVTQEGRELVEEIGHGSHAQGDLWLLLRENFLPVFFVLIFGGILFFTALLLKTGLFLEEREKMYQEAEKVVAGYRDRQWSHLPGGGTGAVYLLFDQVEQLALSLKAECDTEHRAKEFLKDMISDISHQLKTPLAALEMYMEILAEEPGEEETVKHFSEKSLLSLERMEQLVLSLLKMARLDAGTILFEKHVCYVSELVAQGVGELLERGKREGKEILVEGNQEETVFCDMEWTKEAVGNLVKNALDHTKRGDVIQILWQSSPIMLRLFVKDTGCGILPEDIHHIFKRFYRSKKSSDTLGAGLGLSLAKGIVEGQGGILSVESVPGEGTVFVISLTKL